MKEMLTESQELLVVSAHSRNLCIMLCSVTWRH